MNEPMSDALFGIDGTESPEVLPDPSARAGWRDAPDLPPLVLPALPDASVIREAIAAALGEDPTRPVDLDLDASAQPHAAQVKAAQPNPTTQVGGLPPGGSPSHRTVAPSVTTTVASPGPLPRRTVRLPRYRTPLAAASREPVPQIEFGRRATRRGPALPLRTRSNGGAGIALVMGLIIAGLLVYFIIAEIVESVTRLLP
ncbi:MAG: hypothetical protein M3186_10875 [Actinomycetota bacterium]|nr:hypothetical protein [Actinomycetota bacterium]